MNAIREPTTAGGGVFHSTDLMLTYDPLFVKKVYDVVGLYLNPPESAVVLCVDEKSQVQALARSSPVLPMMPERRTHDYVRHGVTRRPND